MAFKGHLRSDVILYKSDGTELLTTTAPGVIHGPSAHDDPASGNPVQIGGVYRAAAPAVADGDVVSLLTDAAGRIQVTQPAGGTLSMLAPVNVTTTPTPLSSLACRSVLLQADPDNTVDVFIGDATNQVWQLVPGQALSLPVSNTNQIYHKVASGTATLNVGAIL